MVKRPPIAAARGFALIDVMVGGILLAIGLTAILTLASRALSLQQRGEREIVASSLLDLTLSTVLAEGPADYAKIHPVSAAFPDPFGEWEYDVELEDGASGVPYRAVASVRHVPTGGRWSCETLIAMKPKPIGAEEEPQRFPNMPIDREARYLEQEEAENAGE